MKYFKKTLSGLITLSIIIALFACSENSIQEKSNDKNIKGPSYTPSPYPEDRFYTEDHVWVKLESESVALIGITTFPLSSIGTVLSTNDGIDEPILGKTGVPGKKIVQILVGSLSNFNVLMPVTGDVDAKNPELEFNPSVINTDTYGLGWILQISNFNMNEVLNLMTASQYAVYVSGL